MAFLIGKNEPGPMETPCPQSERDCRAHSRISIILAFWISMMVVVGIFLSGQTVPADSETEDSLEYRVQVESSRLLRSTIKYASKSTPGPPRRPG
ncbi:MAG: hypothetical protein V2B19_01355 [Pseudomonadota bacterium]